MALCTPEFAAEAAIIRREVSIDFADSLRESGYLGDDCDGIVANTVNMFRVLKAIRFDAPMPLVGGTSLYEWYRSLDLRLHIVDDFADPSIKVSYAVGNEVFMMASRMRSIADALADGKGAPGVPRYFLRQTSAGIRGVGMIAGVLVHEARHPAPGGDANHTCPPNDASLDEGGSFALQYWYFRWLAEHAQLTHEEARLAQELANDIATTRFCDRL